MKAECRMKFIDEAKIEVIGGKGGKGCVSFRREKYVPLGGPNGGDGGKGGDVIFVADEGLHTLMDVSYRRRFRAKNGTHGGGGQKTGAGGDDIVVKVPLGTVVKDFEMGEVICDLNHHGQSEVVAAGGKGGQGNMRFATCTNQAPRKAGPGLPGEERLLKLELKLLADVGLVGFPNAGKSTLISAISNARPKIADYPFTTKVPNLGMVRTDDSDFVVADVPGLIEGAHQGAGMGTAFLKHIERTRLLVYLLDMSDHDHTNPAESYVALKDELMSFKKDFSQYGELIVLTKMDIPEVRDLSDEARELLKKETAGDIYCISAATGDGIKELVHAMAEHVGRKW